MAGNYAGARDVRLLVGAILFVAATAQGACDAPRAKIAEGSTLGETRPLIAWEPIPGATGYRVKVLSRVPDGKVLASHDGLVNTAAFVFPQPLAEQRAKVQMRIAALCGGGKASAETFVSFDIDARGNCSLAGFEAHRDGRTAVLRWKPFAGAQSYEVRALSLMDGKLLASQTTRTANARLEVPANAAVVSVQPSCAAGRGEAFYRVLAD